MVLIATKEFSYGDKALKVGDRFDPASDEDARLLKGWGKARDADAETVQDEPGAAVTGKGLFAEGQQQADQPAKGKRQYRRRDMVSED